MATVEQASITIPSDPHIRKEIKDLIQDVCGLWLQQESFATNATDALKGGAKKFDIPVEYLTKVARMAYKHSYNKEQQKSEDVFALYDIIIGD